MNSKLWIILLVFALSIAAVYAHGEDEDDSGDQPTQTLPQITFDPSRTESIFSQASESSMFSSQFDLTQPQLTLLTAGTVFAIAFGGILWSMVGRQMSIMLVFSTILTAYTGFIHFESGLAGDYLLLANGIGYLFIAMLRTPVSIQTSKFNNVITLGFIVYTTITFLGYFLLHSHVEVIGISSKVAEAFLIIILLRQVFSRNEINILARRTSISPRINYFTQS